MGATMFRIILITISMFVIGTLSAQPGGGGGGQGQGGPPPGGTGGPIDDDAIVLLVAVGAYLYKINKQTEFVKTEINPIQK